ncbi:hypothetical protein [Tabrizicola sp.]|uniref:hypothetical protein n=1 Tax=Tabrizicola sp. TaxID=2005166 RepID=UPI003F3CF88C
MNLTRRAAFSFACLALLPVRLRAATCEPIFTALSLCEARGWRLASVSGNTAGLTHDTGISATITLETGLSEEDLGWARCQVSHAPISARADVLEGGPAEVDGRAAWTSIYLPRHTSPPGVVAMSSFQGDGTSLVIWTRGPGETYSDQHREAHDGLLAALQLDLAE